MAVSQYAGARRVRQSTESSDARTSRVSRVATVVVPAAILVVAGWLRRWTTDDAFINYRIVRMLVEGHGPVFNVGQRVEAYTSPLWIGVLTVGDLVLPIRLEYVSVFCSLALAALGMLALASGAMRLLGRSTERAWVPLGSLVLLALPPMWDFSTSGLEFALSLFWIGGLTWVLARWATTDRPLLTGEAVFVGLGALVRPDMVLYSVVILVFVVACRWSAENNRERLRVLVAVAALPVLYELFRMAYFASLIPNTALAKAADRPHWRAGFAYLRNLFGPYYLPVPILLVAIVAVLVARPFELRRRLTITILPVAGALHALYIVRAGGDYMHARLLLPSLVAVLAPVAVVPVRRMVVPAVAAVALWAVVTAVGLRMTAPVTVGSLIANGRQAQAGPSHSSDLVTAEDQGLGRGNASIRAVGRSGLYAGLSRLPLRPAPGVPSPLALMSAIGVGGYSLGSRVSVLDRLGLADALVARFQVTRTGLIGHEKPIPIPWLVARVTNDPAAADLFGGDGFVRPLYKSPPGRFDRDVAAARRALRCPELQRLQQATQGPLTFRRALSNIWHAPDLTLLRIPPDPNKAVAKFC